MRITSSWPLSIVEAGLTAHLGTVDDHLNNLIYAAPYGMFTLRLGGGYGVFSDGRSPHIAAGLGWGLSLRLGAAHVGRRV
jgi:hypothetical protein